MGDWWGGGLYLLWCGGEKKDSVNCFVCGVVLFMLSRVFFINLICLMEMVVGGGGLLSYVGIIYEYKYF